MSAQQILLPFRPVINLRGGLEAGATLEVYESGTLTPYPIYSNSDLTSSLPNPLTADGFGVFPAVYYDSTQPIRVIVKAADGTVIGDDDPFANRDEGDINEVYPEEFGAVAVEDGASATTSQTTAFFNALNSGKIVNGRGKTYMIGDELDPTDGSMAGLIKTKLKRVAGASQSSQTFVCDFTGQPNILVEDVEIDMGTTENTGTDDDSSRGGIAVGSNNTNPATWLPGIRVRRVKVKGAGNGTGIFCRGTDGLEIEECEVFDRIVTSATATNDVQNGIDLSWGRNTKASRNKVRGLWLRESGVPVRKFSRGILLTEQDGALLAFNEVEDVDQAYDYSGGISASTPNGNTNCVSFMNKARRVRTWGFKFVNVARDIWSIDDEAREFGFAGFVASGPSGALPVGEDDKATARIHLIRPRADTPSDYFTTEVYGIWFSYRPSYPNALAGSRIIDAVVSDNGASGLLQHGILISDGDRNVVAAFPHIEVRGQQISGTTGAVTKGVYPHGLCVAGSNASQAIASGAWTSLEWLTDSPDGEKMHSTTSNAELFVATKPGWHVVACTVPFAPNATGIRGLRIIKNGGSIPGGNVTGPATADANVLNGLSLLCWVYLNTGDNVRAEAYQTSGGPLNVFLGNGQFSVHRLEQMGAT